MCEFRYTEHGRRIRSSAQEALLGTITPNILDKYLLVWQKKLFNLLLYLTVKYQKTMKIICLVLELKLLLIVVICLPMGGFFTMSSFFLFHIQKDMLFPKTIFVFMNEKSNLNNLNSGNPKLSAVFIFRQPENGTHCFKKIATLATLVRNDRFSSWGWRRLAPKTISNLTKVLVQKV